MKTESRELYLYTKNEFKEDLKQITPDCVSPIIAVRKVVKEAINDYIKWNATPGDDIFSQEDFMEVSNKIYNEIIGGTL